MTCNPYWINRWAIKETAPVVLSIVTIVTISPVDLFLIKSPGEPVPTGIGVNDIVVDVGGGAADTDDTKGTSFHTE